MTVPNQRDPDLTQVVKGLMGGLADLKANVISRWGRVPHVAADPASPPDGAVWVRSDDLAARWQANGRTYGQRIGGQWTRVAAQAAASATLTDVLWDTEAAGDDPEGFLTPTSATVTIPAGRGGIYSISGRILFSGTPTNGIVRISTSAGNYDFYPTVIGQIGGFGIIVPLAAASTFKVTGYQASGGPLNMTGNLHVYRIGA